MSIPSKTKAARRPDYHFSMHEQKAPFNQPTRWQLLYSTGAIDLDSDDDYDSLNLSEIALKRLLAAALKGYGATVDLETFNPQMFINSAVATSRAIAETDAHRQTIKSLEAQLQEAQAGNHALHGSLRACGEKIDALNRQIDILNDKVATSNAANAQVASVNGKVGHVALTKHDFAEMDPPSFDMWLRAAGINPAAFKESLHQIEQQFSEVNGEFGTQASKQLTQKDEKVVFDDTNTLSFDETDAPAQPEDTPKQTVRHVNFEMVQPQNGTTVRYFAAMSLGLLSFVHPKTKQSMEMPLFTDVVVEADVEGNGTFGRRLERFYNESNAELIPSLVKDGIPYETRTIVMKETSNG